jgi:hypothetical protein
MLSSEDSSDDEAGDFRSSRSRDAAEEGFSDPESDADEPRSSNGAGELSDSKRVSNRSSNGAGEPGSRHGAGTSPPQEQRLRGGQHPQGDHPPQSADAFEHPESADPAALAGHPEGAEAGQSVAEGAAAFNCTAAVP